MVLALPMYFAGALDAARDLLEEALRPLPGPDWSDMLISIYGRLATIRADTGELERAERTLGEAERYAEQLALQQLPP
jgi:hypothetical protein